MNLKPFNLAEAIANPERVVTRDGKKVTQLTKFEVYNDPYMIRGIVAGRIQSFTNDGKFDCGGHLHHYDLFILPQTKTVWVVVVKYLDVIITKTFDTEDECFNYGFKFGVKVISKPTQIEIEI
jgi:hypothetical protein